jgi:hypothetical protein
MESKTYALHIGNEEREFLASLILAASNCDVEYNSVEDKERAEYMKDRFEHMYNVLKGV